MFRNDAHVLGHMDFVSSKYSTKKRVYSLSLSLSGIVCRCELFMSKFYSGKKFLPIQYACVTYIQ